MLVVKTSRRQMRSNSTLKRGWPRTDSKSASVSQLRLLLAPDSAALSSKSSARPDSPSLALESMKVSESLNTYVVKTLKKELGML